MSQRLLASSESAGAILGVHSNQQLRRSKIWHLIQHIGDLFHHARLTRHVPWHPGAVQHDGPIRLCPDFPAKFFA